MKEIEKGKLMFVGSDSHESGSALLQEAKAYADKGWTVLYISPGTSEEAREAETAIDALTVKNVKPVQGKVRRIIQLCEQEKPDVLLVDDLQLGATELHQLSEAAKELNLLIKVGRPKTKPTGEVPLKGSST